MWSKGKPLLHKQGVLCELFLTHLLDTCSSLFTYRSTAIDEKGCSSSPGPTARIAVRVFCVEKRKKSEKDERREDAIQFWDHFHVVCKVNEDLGDAELRIEWMIEEPARKERSETERWWQRFGKRMAVKLKNLTRKNRSFLTFQAVGWESVLGREKEEHEFVRNRLINYCGT